MIDICSKTTEFFLATYYQIIKSGRDMKNEKRREKNPRLEYSMPLKSHCYEKINKNFLQEYTAI